MGKPAYFLLRDNIQVRVTSAWYGGGGFSVLQATVSWGRMRKNVRGDWL